MKSNLLTHTLGAVLIVLGLGACGQQGSEAPYAGTDATTAPGQQPPLDTTGQTGATTDPYATAVPVDPTLQGGQSEALTGNTDFSRAPTTGQTTGDTLGDRCAGLSGQSLSECLETEQMRRQDAQDPTRTETHDVPGQ
jgi:hypothetical protein